MMTQKDNFKTFYALSIAWQLGFLVIVSVGGFMFLGLWGDRMLKTSPFFLLLGLAVGVIVSVYETYHLIIPLVKDNSSK